MTTQMILVHFLDNRVPPVKKKVKLSRYMPWRHMGGEEV
jgi:hypothetical protein